MALALLMTFILWERIGYSTRTRFPLILFVFFCAVLFVLIMGRNDSVVSQQMCGFMAVPFFLILQLDLRLPLGSADPCSFPIYAPSIYRYAGRPFPDEDGIV